MVTLKFVTCMTAIHMHLFTCHIYPFSVKFAIIVTDLQHLI